MALLPAPEEVKGQPSPPVITQGLNELTIRDGESARLECFVEGNPKPNVVWFREATLIQPSPDFMQFNEENLFSLVIREVFPEDTGRYTMVAKNAYGSATCSTEIMVEENLDLQMPVAGTRAVIFPLRKLTNCLCCFSLIRACM